MDSLPELGQRLRQARKKQFPADDMRAFAIRIGVARATLQKMEKGDLHVGMDKYYAAARLLDMADGFHALFESKTSLFDD